MCQNYRHGDYLLLANKDEATKTEAMTASRFAIRTGTKHYKPVQSVDRMRKY